MKRPSFQFYPSDWRSDNGLQSCSLESQGLWINMMCLMHESEKYGFLMIFPKNLDKKSQNFKENLQKSYEKVLGKFFGLTSNRVRKLLEELESFSVFSRDENGIIYSRRMIKDHELSEKRAACGSLGGNPNLVNQNTSKHQAKSGAKSNLGVEQSPTPSSSTSSSTSKDIKENIKERDFCDDEFDEFWNAYPRKEGKEAAKRSWNKISKADQERVISDIEKRKLTTQWQDKKFIPHASTYLNNKRWNDELIAEDQFTSIKPGNNYAASKARFEQQKGNSNETSSNNNRSSEPGFETARDITGEYSVEYHS